MTRTAKIFLALAIVFSVLLCAWGVTRIVKATSFDVNCAAYIKRAADANTVELAKTELAKAIEYAEENNLTDGISGTFIKNPKNDVGFWYNNMKEAYEELETLPEDATALEKTNVLMKLRESLTDGHDEGTIVTIPEGIDIHPYNLLYFLWGMLSFLAAAIFWFLFYVYWLSD